MWFRTCTTLDNVLPASLTIFFTLKSGIFMFILYLIVCVFLCEYARNSFLSCAVLDEMEKMQLYTNNKRYNSLLLSTRSHFVVIFYVNFI